MQSSYWGYWLVVMGVAIVGLMVSVQGITTNSTQDNLSLREITEASMLEAVDYGYYRDYNEIKINKEKYMEVFIRMLAETMGATDTYEVNFYGIYEAPPKVSVELKSNSGTSFVSTGYDLVSRLDAIIQIHAEQTNGGGNSNSYPSQSGNTGNTGNDNNTTSVPGGNGTTATDPGNTNSPSSGDTVANATCKQGINSEELKGMHGVAMLAKPIYETSEIAKTTGEATPGIKFNILGSNGKYWAIEYAGSCGWVDSTYMAINLKEYIPSMTYSITNASGSIFKTYDGTKEVDIPNLTGKQLYTSEFNDFVPATYSFAQKLKIAQANAQRGGDTLKVYEAYRPVSVTRYATQTFGSLINSNNLVKEHITYSYGANTGNRYQWSQSWFLASNISKHNTGCAVDITIASKEGDMPTKMHQLSTEAIKYYSPDAPRNEKGYSGGMLNSQAARTLSNYMMNGTGLTDLASEWWHYQDDACHSTIGTGATFWSAV
ncbi:MAG: DUF5411 family protein [Ruminococcus sp.]|nr:DUF5411 family protein [Ruminococcus sp.]